jgi:hypothetical protein
MVVDAVVGKVVQLLWGDGSVTSRAGNGKAEQAKRQQADSYR